MKKVVILLVVAALVFGVLRQHVQYSTAGVERRRHRRQQRRPHRLGGGFAGGRRRHWGRCGYVRRVSLRSVREVSRSISRTAPRSLCRPGLTAAG